MLGEKKEYFSIAQMDPVNSTWNKTKTGRKEV